MQKYHVTFRFKTKEPLEDILADIKAAQDNPDIEMQEVNIYPFSDEVEPQSLAEEQDNGR